MSKLFRLIWNLILGAMFVLLMIFVVIPLVLSFLPVVFGFVIVVVALVLVLIPLAWIGSKFGRSSHKRDKGKVSVKFPKDDDR